MRYKEFERKVKELGFYVNVNFGDTKQLYICTPPRMCLSIIDDDVQYGLAFSGKCRFLSSEARKEFFELALEYASTPVEERRTEEKKYNVIAYTELAGHRDKLFSTEKFYGRSGDYLIVSEKFSNGTPEQQWTLEQIKDWNLEGFERIEVK